MPLTLANLPEDIQRYIAGDRAPESEVPSEEVLAAIGVSIAKLRDEAKAAREASGIEARWRDAEEAYAGIDDVNRGEIGSQWTKSMSLNGPITSDDVPDTQNRSTLAVRMTQRYVDAAAAKMGEILLSPGAKSFSFSATPVPDLINAKEDESQVLLDHLPGSPPALRSLKPGEIPPPEVAAPAAQAPAAANPLAAIAAPPGPPPLGGALPVPAPAGGAVSPAGAAGPEIPGQVPGQPPAQPLVPVKVKDLAAEAAAEADKAAKKVEKRIYDWHVECGRSAEVRKVIFDAARLGVGVLKGPFPKYFRSMATIKNGEDIELKILKKIQPASKWVNAWNFYPDPACGENTADGDHVFERDWMSEREVRKLANLPGYIRSQIEKVLIEGPQKINVRDGESRSPAATDAAQLKKGKYEVWFFHGSITREEMGCICAAAGSNVDGMVSSEKRSVDAVVTMINDSVVRATINPLDSGEFPYHVMPWQRRTGSWDGVGVSEQIATPQKMVTAAVRSMLDNAGISAGGQIVIDTSMITPADGDMGMSPHKIWYLNGEGAQVDVNKAFGLFRVDNVTDQLLKIIDLAMRMGEEATSIPLITQGQSGPTQPDTFGAAVLQNSNANQLLRSIGYAFDECITEPETRQYYEWAMLDPDVPMDEKGDWSIDPHGSSALVDMALEKQFIGSLAQLVVNPAYEISPAKWATMFIEANKVDPKKLQYTEEELAALKAQAPPPAAPQIEVAKINAALKEKEIAARTEDAKADNERLDRELLTNVTVELHTLQLKKELALLAYAERQNTNLTKAQAELAKTTMTVQAQERMAATDARARQVAKPAFEPRGRAPNGEAFQA